MTPDRFFSLMLLLESRDATTTHDLASALGVSLRTVTRDLNWLREAGLPVAAQRGRHGGVTMLPGSGFDVTRLTPSERDHLSITGLDEKQREELNMSVDSRRALSKITGTPARRTAEHLPLTDVVHVDSRPWLRSPADGPSPASLIGPLRRGRRLRIGYYSASKARTHDLVVDPYGLLAKAGVWYLVADCARAPRMYRLERITAWSEVDHPRQTRADQTLASVAAALVEQWDRDHAVEVSATIDQEQLERAQRVLGQRLIVQGGPAQFATGYAATIRFRHLEDVRVLLPFGSSIAVHGPAEARARLYDLTVELSQSYAPLPAS